MPAITARTLRGEELVLDQSEIERLRSHLRGPLLLPGDAAYDQSCSIWNAIIVRHPAMIVRCIGNADIVAGVNFAREHEIPLSVPGGGHTISGMALCDGGIVLDMSPRRGIWIDPSLRAAVAQTGCNLGDLDRKTQIHGLAACVGFVSKTGIAGLTVGGGFGYLTRRFGWTSDTVRSMEVVTADGRIVRASDKENPELFWGLRGGGNNFGVVTLIEYSLHDVGPEIVGGAVAWRAEDAMSVLEMIRDLASQAPPELACVAVVRPAPPAPWLPMDVHGKLIVIALLCYSGPIDKGEKLVAPVKSFGKPIGDVLQRRSYVSQQSLLDATQPDGRRNYWKSEYLPAYLPELNSQVIEHAGRVVSLHSSVIVFRLEGALNRLPPDHSAVGNRDAHYVLNIAASWEKEADDEPNIAWARAAPGMN